MKTEQKQQTVSLLNLIAGCMKNHKTGAAVMAWMAALDNMMKLAPRLKAAAANDNDALVSERDINDLMDMIKYLAPRKLTTATVITASLGLEFGVGHLARLRRSQLDDARMYVAKYAA